MTLKYFRQYLLNRQIAALHRQSISGDLHVLMEEEEAEKVDKTDQDDIEHERDRDKPFGIQKRKHSKNGVHPYGDERSELELYYLTL